MTTILAPVPAPSAELPGGSGVGGEAPWWTPTMHRPDTSPEPQDDEEQRAA